MGLTGGVWEILREDLPCRNPFIHQGFIIDKGGWEVLLVESLGTELRT